MNDCDCKKHRCRCNQPVIDVESIPDNVAVLKFNFDGVSTYYDFTSMIKLTETDTSLSADSIDRNLIYKAERHTDTISAKELGSIMRLADISDVDISSIDDNSILMYRKDSDCAEGCEGINNSYVGWNATKNQATSVQTIMGFDANGKPYALQAPANANQYYNLGWNGSNKVSYSQPQDTTVAAVTDSDNKVSILVLDPNTKQVMSVKVLASKLQAMTEA